MKIGINSAKVIRKNYKKSPIFKFEGPPLPRPQAPVFRVVLLHTEASGKSLFRRVVFNHWNIFLLNDM